MERITEAEYASALDIVQRYRAQIEAEILIAYKAPPIRKIESDASDEWVSFHKNKYPFPPKELIETILASSPVPLSDGELFKAIKGIAGMDKILDKTVLNCIYQLIREGKIKRKKLSKGVFLNEILRKEIS